MGYKLQLIHSLVSLSHSSKVVMVTSMPYVLPASWSLLQGPYSKVPLRVLQCACNSSQPKCAKNEYRAAMVSCTQCLYDGVNVHYETYIDIQILNEQTLKRLHWQVTNDLECFN